MSLFADMAALVSADIIEILKNKVSNRMMSQPLFIQALFGDLCWENKVRLHCFVIYFY